MSKVHAEVRRFAAAGYTVLVVGHPGHVEVVGTMGEAPEATVLVSDVAAVAEVSRVLRASTRTAAVTTSSPAAGRVPARDSALAASELDVLTGHVGQS